MRFVHLHTHSDYSLRDAINSVEKLALMAKANNQHAIALTDHGTVGGLYDFHKACKKHGVKPLLGGEFYWTQDRFLHEPDSLNRLSYHMILIAKNNTGLYDLFKLYSLSNIEGHYYKPRIDDDLLEKYGKHLIVTTACVSGYIPRLLQHGEMLAAKEQVMKWANMFPGRLYLELQAHNFDEQHQTNDRLLHISRETGMPLVLTNDAHYPLKHNKLQHEYMLCMQRNVPYSSPKRPTYGDVDIHVATTEEMIELAQAYRFPKSCIENTALIADEVDADDYFSDTMNRYPRYRKKESNPNLTSREILRQEVLIGLIDKFGSEEQIPQTYLDRMEHELHLIDLMNFNDYMLIIKDIVRGQVENGIIMGPGRGSAASSLVSFALGITRVDPLKYNLIFSRFLNVGRAGQPLLFDKETRDRIDELMSSE